VRPALVLACTLLVGACTSSERAPAPAAEASRDPAPAPIAPDDLATTLAKLSKDPTAIPPRTVQAGKDTAGLEVSAYTYDLPREPGPVLLDVLERDKSAWIAVLAPGPGNGLARVAASGAAAQRIESRTGSRWTEITKGPLAGAFVEQKKGNAGLEVKSVPWILAHDEVDIGGWLCHEGRVPGATPKKPADLEQICQTAVRGKLYYNKGLVFSPGLSGPHEIRTSATCAQSWNGWAESDTPWGRHKRDFSCTYDPKKDRLVVMVATP